MVRILPSDRVESFVFCELSHTVHRCELTVGVSAKGCLSLDPDKTCPVCNLVFTPGGVIDCAVPHRINGWIIINKFECVHLCLLACLSPGTEILTVQAADNDDPKTDNVRIFYRLVGQIPESPRALFRVDRDSGVISVQADSMEGTAPQYTLTITAEDAKGDFCFHTT